MRKRIEQFFPLFASTLFSFYTHTNAFRLAACMSVASTKTGKFYFSSLIPYRIISLFGLKEKMVKKRRKKACMSPYDLR